MIKKTITFATMVALAISAYAQDAPTYMRSSIYTFLIKSDEQNAKLDEEVVENNEITGIVKSLAKKQEDTTGLKRSEHAMIQFCNVPIPNQFNDHNLPTRIIDFDNLVKGITSEDVEQFKNAFGEKKKGGGFMKSMTKAANFTGKLSGRIDASASPTYSIDDAMPAVINKYFTSQNVPSNIMAKWFNYDATANTKWNEKLVIERAMENASAEAMERAKTQDAQSLILGNAFDLIGNTYVLGVNLRYRSNAAIMAEAQAIADAVGSQMGGWGKLASKAAGAAAGAALGDGYSIQAVTYLYRLNWDDEISTKFCNEIYTKNASLEDLIASGMCTLTPVGMEKSRSSVRQSITNKRPLGELVKIAVGRAIDEAISKLQSKHEEFRTIVPISKVDNEGNVYAKIGTKEGCKKDDEYEILEAQEDPNTHRITYKAVGKVKVVDKQIWENRYGIADDITDMSEEEQKKEKVDVEAVKLGATTFKGAKKGADYTGYLLRLSKKK